jgi:uncharacterized damage-inducible protein DinB
MNNPPRRLEVLLADHREAVDEFFHRAAQVTSARWTMPRKDGKWTPAEEVKHVVLAYEAFIRDLEGGPPMKLVRTKAWRLMARVVGLGSILWLRRIPRGARAPRETRPAEVPLDQQALVNEFREQTTRFEHIFLATWDREPARCVTHPYFGSLNLTQALRMATVHTRHHAAVLPPPGARQQIGA